MNNLLENFYNNKTNFISKSRERKDIDTKLVKQLNKTNKFVKEHPNLIIGIADKKGQVTVTSKDEYILSMIKNSNKML